MNVTSRSLRMQRIPMTRRTLTTAAIAALILVALVAIVIKARGFRASSTPSAL